MRGRSRREMRLGKYLSRREQNDEAGDCGRKTRKEKAETGETYNPGTPARTVLAGQ